MTPEQKYERVAMARNHREAERLVAGHYSVDSEESPKACAIGCYAFDIRQSRGDNWPLDEQPEQGWHKYVADHFATPEWLEHLVDAVFEGLPNKERADWQVALAEALPVDVDFKSIRHRIQRDILLEVSAKSIGDGDEDWRTQCRAAVQSVAALHDRAIHKKVSEKEWSAAARSAWSAARSAWSAARAAGSAAWAAGSAAWSAARSAWSAARAAGSAAWAAGSAARSAEWSAAWSAEWSAESAAWSAARSAGSAAWKPISEIVLRHLREGEANDQ